MDRRSLVRKLPREKRATIDRVLEPAVELMRQVAIEKNFDRLLLLSRELPHLQTAHVSRRLPIHVPRAFERLVRPDAIKVAPQSAIVRLDLAGDSQQKVVEPGLRIDG